MHAPVGGSRCKVFVSKGNGCSKRKILVYLTSLFLQLASNMCLSVGTLPLLTLIVLTATVLLWNAYSLMVYMYSDYVGYWLHNVCCSLNNASIKKKCVHIAAAGQKDASARVHRGHSLKSDTLNGLRNLHSDCVPVGQAEQSSLQRCDWLRSQTWPQQPHAKGGCWSASSLWQRATCPSPSTYTDMFTHWGSESPPSTLVLSRF